MVGAERNLLPTVRDGDWQATEGRERRVADGRRDGDVVDVASGGLGFGV